MAVNLREEEAYLEGVKEALKAEAERLAEKMHYYSDASGEHIRYCWEEQSAFDGGEERFNQMVLQRLVDSGEQTREQFRRIGKLLDSPYFARIDFREDGEPEAMKVYIGKFSFWSRTGNYEIFDWRAPVSSMYYEFEKGDACYDAPERRVSGVIELKRQYRIWKGILEYALDSDISIHDQVLQQALSENSDRRMKDIAATIQKEQNRLIRNETAEVLIVQGVAGSGKTSIALHRVAYFLYRYRDEIAAENFLILSPNGIFVDYISNVLPELGEEAVRSIRMEEIAAGYLPPDLRTERLCFQTERFQENQDRAWTERNAFKGTAEFVKLLDEYLSYCDENFFTAGDYAFEGGLLEAEYIRRNYVRRRGLPVRERLREIADVMAEEIRVQRKAKGWGTHKKDIFEWLMSEFQWNDSLLLYRDFYRYIGREQYFVRKEGTVLESADIFPLIYVKLYLEGTSGNPKIKYLIVDEMQDYTPVQYAVLNRLYPCRKTVLGDFSQRVVPFAGSSMEFLKELYPAAQVVEVYKSYRSTCEIMEFAQRIQRNVRMEPVQRHGEAPAVLQCGSVDEERRRILELIAEDSNAGGSAKLGIICKSYALAEELYQWLTGHGAERERLHLLTYDSEEFYDGVMVTAVSMSKGLEFDRVVVPDVDDDNYHSAYDRGLLYVACTRAMHGLVLLYCGKRSRCLDESEDGGSESCGE